MFIFLLVLLCINGALSQSPKAGCSNDAADAVRTKILKAHNDIRKKIVAANDPDRVDQDDGTYLPGSKNLFKISYDCALEGLAMTVAAGCPSKPKLDYVPAGKSVNYAIQRGVQNKPTQDSDFETAVQDAVDKWYDYRFEDNLDTKTVLYQNEAMEPFANIIYKNTIAVGCAIIYCDTKRIATACVYNDKPTVGEPLYNPAKPGTKCDPNKKQCAKVIKGAECIQTGDPYEGLCKTDLKEMPKLVTESTVAESESTAAPETKSTAAPATESTAAAAETTAQSSGGMTQELRDKVVNMHNYYRSMLARGLVRNGKVGNPNCPQATNMYKMRYDMAMESEAQMYADSCPARGSQVSARPSLSGENFQIFNSVIISPNDAITHALDTWWTQILKNGVNNQMKYNEYLEMKEQAPIAFTQMAWAESYKVGCGINSSCSYGTVVVCRYSPRGNIYTHFIYRVGNTCASCRASCQDALCPAPAY